MEARLEEKHRWLSAQEICDVLENPNSLISDKPAFRPPRGSIFVFNKKKQKRFRKDGYKWKTAKNGKTVKEAHEKLKVGGTDKLHCYYAHGEEDTNFQRRSYWLIDENFSHIALVHYRNIKDQGDEIRTGEGVLHSRETDASEYNRQEIASSSSIPSNFQHLQATDATNLDSAHTLQPENTVSGLTNWDEFLADPINWESLGNLITGLSNEDMVDTDTIPLHGPNSSTFGDDETACTNSRASSSVAVEPSHSSLGKRQCGKDSTKSKATPLATIEEVDEEEEGNDTNQARKRLKVTCGRKNQEQELEPTTIEPENGKGKAVVQNDFGTGKSHEFSEVAVTDFYKSLRELLDRASAPNTLASSSISTPTIKLQKIATIRATLEMDFTTLAGDVQRTNRISLIKSFVDSTPSRTEIWPILEQLEQPLQAYSKYDEGKNLNAKVEDMAKHLQAQTQFCERMQSDRERLEDEKKGIEAKQAAISADIDCALKQTEPIRAKLEELLRQRDQFKKIEGYLNTSLVIGDGHWTTLQKVIAPYLPP